jgi:hypothetical protein
VNTPSFIFTTMQRDALNQPPKVQNPGATIALAMLCFSLGVGTALIQSLVPQPAAFRPSPKLL